MVFLTKLFNPTVTIRLLNRHTKNKIKMKLKNLLLITIGLVISANAVKGNNHKKMCIIESNAAHGALIIKTTTNSKVLILDENKHAVLTTYISKGINEIDLQNLKAAKYQIIVSDGISSTERKLSIQ